MLRHALEVQKVMRSRTPRRSARAPTHRHTLRRYSMPKWKKESLTSKQAKKMGHPRLILKKEKVNKTTCKLCNTRFTTLGMHAWRCKKGTKEQCIQMNTKPGNSAGNSNKTAKSPAKSPAKRKPKGKAKPSNPESNRKTRVSEQPSTSAWLCTRCLIVIRNSDVCTETCKLNRDIVGVRYE